MFKISPSQFPPGQIDVVAAGQQHPNISITSFASMGGMVLGSNSIQASAVFPVANKALFYPVRVQYTTKFLGIAVENGSVASGNIDVGLYDIFGNRLASAGSTAQTGTSTVQNINFTAAKTVAPGTYFIAIAMDNITGTFLIHNIAIPLWAEACSMQEMAAAFPLPSTATFANPAASYIPLCTLMVGTVL